MYLYFLFFFITEPGILKTYMRSPMRLYWPKLFNLAQKTLIYISTVIVCCKCVCICLCVYMCNCSDGHSFSLAICIKILSSFSMKKCYFLIDYRIASTLYFSDLEVGYALHERKARVTKTDCVGQDQPSSSHAQHGLTITSPVCRYICYIHYD